MFSLLIQRKKPPKIYDLQQQIISNNSSLSTELLDGANDA